MLIELRLDRNGRGEGKRTVDTKLEANAKTGEIVLENYGTEPVPLANVKRETK